MSSEQRERETYWAWQGLGVKIAKGEGGLPLYRE